MLVGFFDLFVVFVIGLLAATALSRRPTAPAMTRFWGWVVGGLFGLCMFASAASLNAAMNAPMVVGTPTEVPPMAGMGRRALAAAHVVTAGGILWLGVLAAMTFTRKPDEAPPEEDAD